MEFILVTLEWDLVDTIQRYEFPHRSGLFLHPQSSLQQSTLDGRQRRQRTSAYVSVHGKPTLYSELDRFGIYSKAVAPGLILVGSPCLLLSIH